MMGFCPYDGKECHHDGYCDDCQHNKKEGEEMTREVAINVIWDRCQHCKETEEAIKFLKEERPHGEWIMRHYINGNDWTKSFDMYVCSNCGEEFSYDAETGVSMNNYNTCPNCMADMRKEGEAE